MFSKTTLVGSPLVLMPLKAMGFNHVYCTKSAFPPVDQTYEPVKRVDSCHTNNLATIEPVDIFCPES